LKMNVIDLSLEVLRGLIIPALILYAILEYIYNKKKKGRCLKNE
jgi:hypothetical protein